MTEREPPEGGHMRERLYRYILMRLHPDSGGNAEMFADFRKLPITFVNEERLAQIKAFSDGMNIAIQKRGEMLYQREIERKRKRKEKYAAAKLKTGENT